MGTREGGLWEPWVPKPGWLEATKAPAEVVTTPVARRRQEFASPTRASLRPKAVTKAS